MPRLLASLTRTSARPATWDAFIRESVPGRWVVVSLTSGDIFVGQVDMAEVGAASDERDLILDHPGTLDDKGDYEPTSFHAIFLPAGLIQNIATLARPNDRSGPHPGAGPSSSGG